MQIAINERLRIASDRRQWMVQQPKGGAWESFWYFPGLKSLIESVLADKKTRALAKRNELRDAERISAAIEEAQRRIEQALSEHPLRRIEDYWKAHRPLPPKIVLADGIRIAADPLQFRAEYLGARGSWQPEHYHRDLAAAVCEAHLRTVRESDTASADVAIRLIDRLGQQFAEATHHIIPAAESTAPAVLGEEAHV